MNRKVIFAALIAFLVVVVAAWFLASGPAENESNPGLASHPAQAQKQKEITIRNVTHETVTYRIKPFNSDGQSRVMTLEVGRINRFPGELAMDVFFEQGDETITYRLSPGTPYSFRYNENDELELYEGSHGRTDAEDLAPWVPTPMVVVEKMLEMAKVDKDDILYDLGCGDGRIVILAAEKYGTRGVGIDIDPQRIREAIASAKMAGIEHLVEFRENDVMKVDFSEATVVALYLLEESNALLQPLFDEQLKPGTYVVSHNYSVPGWEAKEVGFVTLKSEDGEEHDIYLYQK